MTTDDQLRVFKTTTNTLDEISHYAVAATTKLDITRLIRRLLEFQASDDFDREFESEFERLTVLLARIRELLPT